MVCGYWSFHITHSNFHIIILRKHAKVDTASTTCILQLGDANLEAAKKDWENMELSDVEEEDKNGSA